MKMHWVALITILTVIMQFALVINVGLTRRKYNIQAPAVVGHPTFERAYRVQVNTIENTLIFLPSLWLFAVYINYKIAIFLGAVWLIGRLIYAVMYQLDPKKRALGFGLAAGAILILMLGSLYGIVKELLWSATP
ncbi:MAG: MAPEG family protein [Pseudomonadota bacterium]